MKGEPGSWVLYVMLLVVLIATVLFRRRGRHIEAEVLHRHMGAEWIRVDEMPSVIEQIPTEADLVFATFMFHAYNDQQEENLVNLNIVVVDGRKQFDWYLGAPKNIEDADRFLEFASSKGYEFSSSSTAENFVVRNEDIGAICIAVATEMYGLSPDDKIEVMRHW